MPHYDAPAPDTADDIRWVSAQLPDDLFTRFKVAVIRKGRDYSTRAALIDAIEQWVSKEEASRARK